MTMTNGEALELAAQAERSHFKAIARLFRAIIDGSLQILETTLSTLTVTTLTPTNVVFGGVTHTGSTGSIQKFVDVTVSSAEILALNATPKTLVAAPGAGRALIFEGALAFLDYGAAAYAGIAAGEDLSIKYTNGSGTAVGEAEATGFLDATADAIRYIRPTGAASGVSDITPVANAALVLHMLTGEITTGDSPLKLRVFYRDIPTTL